MVRPNGLCFAICFIAPCIPKGFGSGYIDLSDVAIGSSPDEIDGLNGFRLPEVSRDTYHCFNVRSESSAIFAFPLQDDPDAVIVFAHTVIQGLDAMVSFSFKYPEQSLIWWTPRTCESAALALSRKVSEFARTENLFATTIGAAGGSAFKSRAERKKNVVWQVSKKDSEKEFRWWKMSACVGNVDEVADLSVSVYSSELPDGLKSSLICDDTARIYHALNDAVGVQAEVIQAIGMSYKYPPVSAHTLKERETITFTTEFSTQPVRLIGMEMLKAASLLFNIGSQMTRSERAENGIAFKKDVLMTTRQSVVNYMKAQLLAVDGKSRTRANQQSGSLDRYDATYLLTADEGRVNFLSSFHADVFFDLSDTVPTRTIQLGSLVPTQYGVYVIPAWWARNRLVDDLKLHLPMPSGMPGIVNVAGSHCVIVRNFASRSVVELLSAPVAAELILRTLPLMLDVGGHHRRLAAFRSVLQSAPLGVYRVLFNSMRLDLCVKGMTAMQNLIEELAVRIVTESTHRSVSGSRQSDTQGTYMLLSMLYYQSLAMVSVLGGVSEQSWVRPNMAQTYTAYRAYILSASVTTNETFEETGDANRVGGIAPSRDAISRALEEEPGQVAASLLFLPSEGSANARKILQIATSTGSRISKDLLGALLLCAASSDIDVSGFFETSGLVMGNTGFEHFRNPYATHQEFLSAVASTKEKLFRQFGKEMYGHLFTNNGLIFDFGRQDKFVEDLLRAPSVIQSASNEVTWPTVYLPNMIFYGVHSSLAGSQHSVGMLADFLGGALSRHMCDRSLPASASLPTTASLPDGFMPDISDEELEAVFNAVEVAHGTESAIYSDDGTDLYEPVTAFGWVWNYAVPTITRLGAGLYNWFKGAASQASVSSCLCVVNNVLYFENGHIPFNEHSARFETVMGKLLGLIALHRQSIGFHFSNRLLKAIFLYVVNGSSLRHRSIFVQAFAEIYFRHSASMDPLYVANALRALQVDLVGREVTEFSDLISIPDPHDNVDPVSSDIFAKAFVKSGVTISEFAKMLIGNPRIPSTNPPPKYTVMSLEYVPAGEYSAPVWSWMQRCVWIDHVRRQVVLHPAAHVDEIARNLVSMSKELITPSFAS